MEVRCFKDSANSVTTVNRGPEAGCRPLGSPCHSPNCRVKPPAPGSFPGQTPDVPSPSPHACGAPHCRVPTILSGNREPGSKVAELLGRDGASRFSLPPCYRPPHDKGEEVGELVLGSYHLLRSILACDWDRERTEDSSLITPPAHESGDAGATTQYGHMQLRASCL